jgi:hypothetical protein
MKNMDIQHHSAISDPWSILARDINGIFFCKLWTLKVEKFTSLLVLKELLQLEQEELLPLGWEVLELQLEVELEVQEALEDCDVHRKRTPLASRPLHADQKANLRSHLHYYKSLHNPVYLENRVVEVGGVHSGWSYWLKCCIITD